jgi:hypothetical protein
VLEAQELGKRLRLAQRQPPAAELATERSGRPSAELLRRFQFVNQRTVSRTKLPDPPLEGKIGGDRVERLVKRRSRGKCAR